MGGDLGFLTVLEIVERYVRTGEVRLVFRDVLNHIENLDLEGFQRCMAYRQTPDGLKPADEEQRSRGITSQPVFEIGQQRLVGLQSFERMSEAIETASK